MQRGADLSPHPWASLLTAGVATPCDTQLGALEATIAGATSLSEKDRAALLGKVTEPQLKFGAGKSGGAAQKLADIDAKLTALETSTKISTGDAAAIRAALTEANAGVSA